MARIHTRTNNVDTRVQGLFCNYIKSVIGPPRKVPADPNVFYLQTSSISEMPVYRTNEREHTSCENVRTENVEVRQSEETHTDMNYLL